MTEAEDRIMQLECELENANQNAAIWQARAVALYEALVAITASVRKEPPPGGHIAPAHAAFNEIKREMK